MGFPKKFKAKAVIRCDTGNSDKLKGSFCSIKMSGGTIPGMNKKIKVEDIEIKFLIDVAKD